MAQGTIGSIGRKLIGFSRELLLDEPLAEVDGITEQGWWTGGQETPAHGRGRAMATAVELQERARARAIAGEPPERIGIVSHGDFMSSMVKALTDQLPSWNTYYSHDNTAIDRFSFGADLFRIRYLNRIAHLDKPELVSQ
jgi:broad specificity phosphatase PhoE